MAKPAGLAPKHVFDICAHYGLEDAKWTKDGRRAMYMAAETLALALGSLGQEEAQKRGSTAVTGADVLEALRVLGNEDIGRLAAEAATHAPAAKKADAQAHPKRPTTAYFSFLQKRRAELGQAGGGVAELSKRLGAEWKELSAADKAEFEASAAADKERYEVEMELFRKGEWAPEPDAKRRRAMPDNDGMLGDVGGEAVLGDVGGEAVLGDVEMADYDDRGVAAEMEAD
eukprot:TRINITY_DN764_c0_g1_i1.p2 TRINITY_DN764_c0_g1~~TRINITY_DN764_c0_g1_i1.p2  ORF type:complete len:247 (+),score=113.97 TRINITY_DN764_c0_g1_i1:57-743(+)